jgi:hypothetical protein
MDEVIQAAPVEEQQPAEVVQQTEDQQPHIESDPYESEAREQGWRPKEEFEGDPEKWRPAKEFVERGELFGKIDTLGKELKETKKALKMLQEHHSKVKETEFKRAVEELKGLQKKHLEEGNSDEYIKTTELLTDLKAEQKAREVMNQQQAEQQKNQVDPRFTDWVAKNSWYNKDQEMKQFADTLGLGYAQANPGVDPDIVLEYVSKQVKQAFKNKFENPNRTKPSAVEGASTPSTAKKDSIELSDDERRVMNTFIRQGVMTKEEYIAQVKAMRG